MKKLVKEQANYIVVLTKELEDIKSLSDEKNKVIEKIEKENNELKQKLFDLNTQLLASEASKSIDEQFLTDLLDIRYKTMSKLVEENEELKEIIKSSSCGS